MAVRALARGIGISPRRLRRVVDTVRGRRVEEALVILQFLPTSEAAAAVAKVVRSAAANAENNLNLNPQELRIVGITVDPGPSLKRFQPMARGRAGRVQKRSSHITVIVDEQGR